MRPGKPYPATFRMSVDPPGIEPGFPVCRTGVLPLDDEPLLAFFTVESFTILHLSLILGLESALRIAHPPKGSAHGAAHTPATFASGFSSATHSGPPGSRTPITWVQAKRPPIERAARFRQWSVRESNPISVLTTDVCYRNTSLEARDDLLFTIGPGTAGVPTEGWSRWSAEGMGFEPTSP